MTTPNLVFFAVQAGVRLYGAVRRADIDATRAAPLVLPLPRAPGVDVAAARTWFLVDGKEAATDEVRALLLVDTLSAEQKARLVALYRDLRGIADGAEGAGATVEELTALLTVRQWSEGEGGAPPSPLATVAGEVVNVAIDYFAHTPGAVSTKRPEGRALLAVLEVLDTQDFQGRDISDAAGQIVQAVMGAVAANPDLVSGGEREQLLVKSAAGALAKSAADHIAADLPSAQRWRAATWLSLLGGAVLEGGVDAVGANSTLFLGDADPRKTVLFDVTKSLADLLVGEDGKVTTAGIGSAQGLHVVVRAAVESVSENPGVLGADRRGVRTIVVGVLNDVLGQADGLPPDLGPEVIRSILDRTAENLALVFPDAAGDARKNLLLTAAGSLLRALGEKPADGAWRPALSRTQILEILDDVLDEIVDDPAWLEELAAGVNDDLGAAVRAAIAGLRETSGDRLTTDAAAGIVRAAVFAVIENRGLLEKIPGPDDASERAAVEAAVAAVVAGAFGDRDGVQDAVVRVRSSVVAAMTAAALDALARRGITPDAVEELAERIAVVREVVEDFLASAAEFDLGDFLETLEFELDELAGSLPDGGVQ